MNISLIGYGKMGKEIEKLCIAKGHHIYSIADPTLNTEIEVIQGADLAIEFSQPASAVSNLKYCFDHSIPVVCGTTGWHLKWDDIKDYCAKKNGSLFYSTNFSIGVNIFWKISSVLSKIMNEHTGYSLGLHEIHHDQKKDAPSGTAVTLAEKIIGSSSRFDAWKPSDSFTWSEAKAIPISSERIGTVPGTHTVEFKSNHDRIILTHEAFSRGGFVEGVVKAAEWLQGKKGVFGMEDLMNAG